MKLIFKFYIVLVFCFLPISYSFSATVLIDAVIYSTSTPLNPSSYTQCADLMEEGRIISKKISVYHDKCLKANSGSTRAPVGECSVAACEEPHLRRFSFQKDLQEEWNQCMFNVSNNRSKLVARVNTDEGLQATKTYLNNKLNSQIFRKAGNDLKLLFDGVSAEDAKSAGRVAAAVARVLPGVVRTRDACLIASKDPASCELQVLVSLQEVTSRVPSPTPGQGVAYLFQRAMLARLAIEHRDAFKRLDESLRRFGDYERTLPRKKPIEADERPTNINGGQIGG